MIDASSLYQHFPIVLQPIINRDKPAPGYIAYQNMGQEEFKMVLELTELYSHKFPKATQKNNDILCRSWNQNIIFFQSV